MYRTLVSDAFVERVRSLRGALLDPRPAGTVEVADHWIRHPGRVAKGLSKSCINRPHRQLVAAGLGLLVYGPDFLLAAMSGAEAHRCAVIAGNMHCLVLEMLHSHRPEWVRRAGARGGLPGDIDLEEYLLEATKCLEPRLAALPREILYHARDRFLQRAKGLATQGLAFVEDPHAQVWAVARSLGLGSFWPVCTLAWSDLLAPAAQTLQKVARRGYNTEASRCRALEEADYQETAPQGLRDEDLGEHEDYPLGSTGRTRRNMHDPEQYANEG